jgi:hypothetical protein
VKCCLLNGAVFWTSILIFENLVLPALQMVVFLCMAGMVGSSEFRDRDDIPLLLEDKK